jgi:hypothetical protein
MACEAASTFIGWGAGSGDVDGSGDKEASTDLTARGSMGNVVSGCAAARSAFCAPVCELRAACLLSVEGNPPEDNSLVGFASPGKTCDGAVILLAESKLRTALACAAPLPTPIRRLS